MAATPTDPLDALVPLFTERDPGRPAGGLIGPSLASYLPFVGARYPWGDRPRAGRVLVYGMAQNLAGYPTLVKRYAAWPDRGLRRFQRSWAEDKRLPFRPWETMHTQVVTAFALKTLEGKGLKAARGCVTEASACTNLVKWAYRTKKGTDLNPPPAAFEWAEPYVQAELDLLKPDLVIALGGKVSDALDSMGVEHVKVRHSSALVLNPLRGVGGALHEGPLPDAVAVDVPTLVEQWMQALAPFEFRDARNVKAATSVVDADLLRERLATDWLYFLLAQREITRAVAEA